MTTGDEAVGPDMCSSKAHRALVELVRTGGMLPQSLRSASFDLVCGFERQ